MQSPKKLCNTPRDYTKPSKKYENNWNIKHEPKTLNKNSNQYWSWG